MNLDHHKAQSFDDCKVDYLNDSEAELYLVNLAALDHASLIYHSMVGHTSIECFRLRLIRCNCNCTCLVPQVGRGQGQ